MTTPVTQFPNESYLEGLRNVDAAIFETIYTEFRKPVVRAVESAGGSAADGYTFFRVAVIQSSSLARDMQLDASIPVFYLLKHLAVTHFRDWASEKGLELPELPPVPEEEAGYAIELPNADARQEFRQLIRARRQFSRLDTACQKTIVEIAKDTSLEIKDPRLEGDVTTACLEKYRQNLGATPDTWATGMPAVVVKALTDEHFQNAWKTADALENRLSMGQTSAKQPDSNVTRNVLIALGILLLGYGIWVYFSPPPSPKVVYDENFKPPVSIVEDRAARFANDTLPRERNELCEQLFEEADAAYREKSYNEAASILYTITGDEMGGCNSDALFYLGIIGLHLEEPDITIQCFAKIPDLDRFGEDVYWYQALAFVKIAAQNPLRCDIARRAVERARSNTELPERRAQAEKMLEQLAE